MTTIYTSTLKIQGSPLQGENPLPFFRDLNHNSTVELRSSKDGVSQDFPAKYTELLGSQTGFRMLPYNKQDRYNHELKDIELKTIVLENSILRAEFLADYGGRLWSLYNKKEKKELLYKNPVFKLSNLAIRNAWFSGGIEWNAGQYGHAFSTCEPLFFAKLQDESGNAFLRMWEYERCKNFFWHIDFHLPPDSGFLYTYTEIHNTAKEEIPFYYWTNTALCETPHTRVFSASQNCIYIDPFPKPGTRRFGYAQLPFLPTMKEVDSTYPLKSRYANEYFFTCDTVKMPFEVTAEKDGTAFFDVSTDRLKYRKMFCWGNLQGGRRWAQFLSQKDSFYFEAQAGLAPTQIHGIQLPAQSVWSWTQVFGSLTNLDFLQTHQNDYQKAREYVEKKVFERMCEQDVYSHYEQFAKSAQFANKSFTQKDILHYGSGWGALEVERRKKMSENPIPASFIFPKETIGKKQKPWIDLLQTGVLPAQNPADLPFSYIVRQEWFLMLKNSVQKQPSWNAYNYLGICYMEAGQVEQAFECWNKSIELTDNVWARRNIAYVTRIVKSAQEALPLYETAIHTEGALQDRSIAEEYITLLVQDAQYQKAVTECERIQSPEIEKSDKLAAQYGYALAFTGNIEKAEKILKRKFADIREGETPLTDIWYEIEAVKLSRMQNIPVNEEIRNQIKRTQNPPDYLDFRMRV